MKIQNIRSESFNDRKRITANIVWENFNRDPFDLYYETNNEFADDLEEGPHTFLTACAMPALYFGEKRIILTEGVCPKLKDGITTALNWVKKWNASRYSSTYKIPEIVGPIHSSKKINNFNRAGFFFSGGIDALCTLHYNHRHFPQNHPAYLKDAIVVCGLEVGDENPFCHVTKSLSVITENAGIKLIPVYTNIRLLGPESDKDFWGYFWVNEFMGAAFSSIAHAAIPG